jgi:hypothetical protein
MRKFIPLLSIASLALLFQGCGGDSPPEQTKNTAPTPKKSPPQVVEPAGSQSAAVDAPVFPTSPLIPASNPAQLRKEAPKGRLNPFAILPSQPIITFEKSGNNADANTSAQAGKVNTADKKVAQGTKGDPCANPQKTASQTPIVTYLEVPAPPVPNEARGVVVSGVINIGSSLVAIVKAPKEASARQVTPGTFLSNGLVKVKAIENSAEGGRVILAQNGQIVTRSVGQAAQPPLPQPPPKRIPIISKQSPVKTASSPLCPPTKVIKG